MQLMRKRKDDKPPQRDRHKTPRKQVPIPLELVERLQRVANLNERPMSREVARAIRAHVEAEERRLGISPETEPHE